MRRFLLYIMFVLTVSSCSDPVEIPPDVLSQEKMAAILTDVQLVEAQIQMEQLERNDSTKTVVYGYYKYIFQKHKISPEQFKTSFMFYSNHLDLLEHIYDDVLINLSKREAGAE